ncbi:hypothetical protein [Nitrosomonas sp. sh817]|uniref:hypothetical protein n=1 Tax=Nitrosomonas sp. sh817 TaxID=3070658 RepID=UPI0027DD6327|nr:hypothetical protein [Nitrosomonas sp. sh817]WMJ09733.1 hypothetical protein RBH92_05935 [Nitrosomonas sp. sh817]
MEYTESRKGCQTSGRAPDARMIVKDCRIKSLHAGEGDFPIACHDAAGFLRKR